MNILFVVHEISLTGVPILLKQLLVWLKNAHPNFKIYTLVQHDTQNTDLNIQEYSEVFFWANEDYPPETIKQKIVYGVKKKIGTYQTNQQKLLDSLKSKNIDVVLAMTSVLTDILPILKHFLQVPLVCYVHEMDYVRKLMCDEEKLIQNTDYYIFPSKAVLNSMSELPKAKKEKAIIVYDFLGDKQIEIIDNLLVDASTQIRKKLDIPEKAFVVLNAATPQWRKGVDVFLQTAYQVQKKTEEEIYFVWIGGKEKQADVWQIKQDIKNMGLEKSVKFVSSQKHPQPYLDYMNISDIFFQSSKEDPFPIANLEAAYLSKPILCFDKTGGTPELMRDYPQWIIPYGDIEEAANRILLLINDKEAIKKVGNELHDLVKSNYKVEVAGQKIIAFLQAIKENQ